MHPRDHIGAVYAFVGSFGRSKVRNSRIRTRVRFASSENPLRFASFHVQICLVNVLGSLHSAGSRVEASMSSVLRRNERNAFAVNFFLLSIVHYTLGLSSNTSDNSLVCNKQARPRQPLRRDFRKLGLFRT